ncbi:MAG TPA: sporulation integral membrane protein YtvI [Clostridia bacterium]|nr:sporulation integral membrane protein YtvI [Clostridia bacterium]
MRRLKPITYMVLKWLGIAALFTLAIFLFFTQVLKYIAPFIIAFLIVLAIDKPVGFFEKQLKLPRGLAVALMLLIFFVVVGGIFGFVFYKIITEIWKLAMEISKMDFDPLVGYFQDLFEKGQDLYFSLPESLITSAEESIELDLPRLSRIATEISSWLMDIVKGAIGFIKFLPDMVVFIVVTVVSTYFMSRDKQKIGAYIYKRIPVSWMKKVNSLKKDMLLALGGFMKAQIILMAVTFLELLIGFQIIGVQYAFFFAFITALVDLLPVLGTGTILIPTSIVYFITGDMIKGLSFLILYVVIFIVRQFLEPKVVSESLGLHPLLTLMSIYIGLKLMGIAGMILGPIVVIIVKAFYKAGIFPKWKTESHEG